MQTITDCMKTRRSVRTYDGRALNEPMQQTLLNFARQIQNPFQIPVSFRFLEAKEHGLSCPVVTGTQTYVGGKIEVLPYANVAFGYSFEAFILHAQSLGLGTVWLGGTMNRSAFEQAMALEENEMMPCATPIGFPEAKMSVREMLMRSAVKADMRLPFAELFFDGDLHTPLLPENAGRLRLPLEMVRLAPSAVNRQPWRVAVCGDHVHFYLKRSKGAYNGGRLDMQMTDMGIALCHFALSAQEQGLTLEFGQADPNLAHTSGLEYVATYRVA